VESPHGQIVQYDHAVNTLVHEFRGLAADNLFNRPAVRILNIDRSEELEAEQLFETAYLGGIDLGTEQIAVGKKSISRQRVEHRGVVGFNYGKEHKVPTIGDQGALNPDTEFPGVRYCGVCEVLD